MKYLRYLHETNQDEKVAEMKMEEGRLTEAVELYLQSNRPVQAANLIIDNSNLSDEDALIRRVIEALQKQKIYNKAGELWEMSRNYDQALENYEKGNDYSKAVNVRFFSKQTSFTQLNFLDCTYSLSRKSYRTRRRMGRSFNKQRRPQCSCQPLRR